MGVETFGFDQGLALESESALAGGLRGLGLCSLIEDDWLRSGRGGEDEELAVSEDSVDVEEEEFDFASAGLGG